MRRKKGAATAPGAACECCLGTQRVDESSVRTLLQQTFTGEPIMQTFIDRYIEQGINQGPRLGKATALLRQIERKFGPPSDSVRERVLAADSEPCWRGPTASSTPSRCTRCCTDGGEALGVPSSVGRAR
jgi:hypothetical protein